VCHSSERKQPDSRVLYLVLFDTFLESESVTLILNKNKSHFWTDLLPWKRTGSRMTVSERQEPMSESEVDDCLGIEQTDFLTNILMKIRVSGAKTLFYEL
jgi:hypothetical protein